MFNLDNESMQIILLFFSFSYQTKQPAKGSSRQMEPIGHTKATDSFSNIFRQSEKEQTNKKN